MQRTLLRRVAHPTARHNVRTAANRQIEKALFNDRGYEKVRFSALRPRAMSNELRVLIGQPGALSQYLTYIEVTLYPHWLNIAFFYAQARSDNGVERRFPGILPAFSPSMVLNCYKIVFLSQ